MNHCPAAKIRRARFSHFAAALLFLFSPSAYAVPGDEADPPLPPTNFGDLFVFGPHVRDCKISESGGNSATIEFRSNYIFNQARYLDTAGVWSSWQSLSVHEYVCAAPNCLWFGGQVEIRGCTDSAGTNCPGACSVNAGPGVGGRPSVDPVGLPVPIVHHAGCAQTGHKEVTFQAQWTGTAANGYPRVKDAQGNAIALTQVTGARANRVYTGTYTIPAGWESGFDGIWPFEFQLDAERVRKVNVKVSEHCLNAPQVFELDTAGTRTRVSDGAGVSVDVNSQMVIETGNSGLTLTDHVLDPSTQTMGTVFRPTVPSAGTTLKTGWSEAGTAWDGRKYTSPQTNVNMTAGRNACVEDGTHTFWLDPAAPSFTLPDSTAATPVATVRTDACEGAVSSKLTITPNNWHSLFGTIQVHWNVLDGSEASGWEVQATPALAYGMILDGAKFSGTGWPSTGAEISVDRAGATTCPPGERVTAGICQPCPDYQACVGGVVMAAQWCSAGSPPADARLVSYQSCVSGKTQNVTDCVLGGDPDPTDTPCPICGPTERLVENAGVWSCAGLTCPPGEYADAGVCEPCTDYEACVGGLLTTRQWCQPGAVPADAVEVNHQACVGGSTQTVMACVAPGDPTPLDAPCSNCLSGERLVGTNCEACPQYQACSSGSLTTVQWCNAGNPPADAVEVDHQVCVGGTTQTVTACVAPGDPTPSDAPCSTCPAGQRLMGVNCEPCPDYQVCSSGSLTTVEWCNSGNPPADATQVNYGWCDAGTTQNLSVCVNPGGSAPTDAPCPPEPTCAGTEEARWDSLAYSWVCVPIVCPTGQSAVAGVCEPCPQYQVCSGNALATVNWCNAGNPPSDATLETHHICSGNSLVSETVCVAPGGSAPADSFTVSVQWCDAGTTRNRTQCVAAGATPPSDSPCSSCPSGERLVGVNCEPCPQYQVCSGNSLATVNWCQAGSPPSDAMLNTYKRCSGGSLVDTTDCLNPGETGTPDESRYSYRACNGNSLVTRYSCSPQSSATLEGYQACNGNSLVNRTACVAPGGSAPADATTVSVQWCDSGTTRNRTHCVAAGATPPSDAPCSSCPSGERLVGLNCEPCPQYQVCSGNSRVTVNWCQADSPPSDATLNTYKRCSSGTLVDTTECLNPGETGTPDVSRHSYQACNASGTNLVTRYSCSPQTSATLNTFRECSGGVLSDTTECLNPGDIASLNEVRYSYSACNGNSLVTRYACTPQTSATLEGYQACNGNSLVNRTACVAPGGSAPSDATLNTYERCSNGVLTDTTECVVPGGTASSDEVRYSYSACNGNSLVTRYACTPQQSAALNTYKQCSNGVLTDNTECVVPGGTASSDEVRYSYKACNGNSLVTLYACTDRADATMESYLACSGNSLANRSICVAPGGSAPANATLNDYKVCSNGVLSNTSECLDPGDSATPDAVSYSYQACNSSNTALVQKYSCTQRQDDRMVTVKTCSGNNLVDSSICVAAGTIVDPGAELYTYKRCVGGQLVDTTVCLGPGDPRPPNETRYSYQACNASKTGLEQSYSCSAQPNSRLNTYKTCSGSGVLSDRTECLNPGDSGTPDAVRYSYQDCNSSGTGLETKYACSSRGNSWMHTYSTCSGAGVLSNVRECLNPGGSETSDAVRYSYQGCSGNSLATRYACTDQADDYLHSYTTCSSGSTGSATECLSVGDPETVDAVVGTRRYCVGGAERTENVCGADRDDRSATRWYCEFGAQRSEPLTGTCTDDDDRSAMRLYCDSNGLSQNETVTGTCTNDDDRSATETYCSGSTLRTRSISYTCTDLDSRETFCPSGRSFNDDSCLVTAAACPAGEVADGWLSAPICGWNCVPDTSDPLTCDEDEPVTPSDCTASPATGFAWSLTSGDLTGVAYADGTGWWAETYNQANPNSGWTSLALCKPCP